MNMLVRLHILMHLLKREQKKGANQTSNKVLNQDSIQNQLLKPFKRAYRILPHDLGFRDHLPNYRYLSFIELNITGWLTQCVYALPDISAQHSNIKWVISMQEMVYLQQVKFLDKITVNSQVEGWDEKYIYFQHHFYVKNKVRAIGLTKFVLMDENGKLTPQLLGMQGEKLTEVINTWNANQIAIKQQ